MPKVSIIVPIYNAEKYIHRCIESIFTQTFQDFELILVDDGSPDNCGSICDGYMSKDGRVRVIHQENRGQAAARNRGVVEATSEWIAFVDADDMIHPQYLKILYDAVCKFQVKISICDAHEGEACPDIFWHEQTGICHTFTMTEQLMTEWFNHQGDVSKYTYWIVWGKLIHKSILQKYTFTEGRIFEDNAVVFKWLYEAKTVAYCNCVMYFYYVNPSGTTKSSYQLKRLDWLWAVQEHIDFYKAIKYTQLETAIRKRYIWEALREYKNIYTLLKDNHSAKKLRRHIIRYCMKNKKLISLDYSEKMEILSRLYPRAISVMVRLKKRFTKCRGH